MALCTPAPLPPDHRMVLISDLPFALTMYCDIYICHFLALAVPQEQPLEFWAPFIHFSSLCFLPDFAGLSWYWLLSLTAHRLPSLTSYSQLTMPSPPCPSRRGSGNLGCLEGREECSTLLAEDHCLLISKEAGDFNYSRHSWREKLETVSGIYKVADFSCRSHSRSLNTLSATSSCDVMERTGLGV